ncbi:MAG: hypothetical protein IPN68_03280 [Bacteroidetes bacterium]|nr:hypothetical protein [Bacteroidota bacterium]
MKNSVKLKSTGLTILCVLLATVTFGNTPDKTDSLTIPKDKFKIDYRHSAGSSLLLLGNIGDSVRYIQLNYGYRLTQKDNFIAEAITWTYYEPLGTYMHSKEYYPGKVKAYGIGLGYQRFLWKNLFITVEPTFFLQQFSDTEDKKLQKGFQLYLQFIVGYRFEFLNKRLFIEPAYALKYWPVNTNFPETFSAIEHGAPKYKFEPSLNFGFRF